MQVLTVNFFPQFMHTDLNKFCPDKKRVCSLRMDCEALTFQSQFLAHYLYWWVRCSEELKRHIERDNYPKYLEFSSSSFGMAAGAGSVGCCRCSGGSGTVSSPVARLLTAWISPPPALLISPPPAPSHELIWLLTLVNISILPPALVGL